MAFQGEYFVDRYGAKAAESTPPIQRMLSEGVPVGAGTDATRVASYNPWTALYWLTSGKTVGGTQIYPQGLSRATALELFTHGSAWFSSEQGKKGQIKVGQLADLVALSADYFAVEEEQIKWLESVLTVVGGKVVYATTGFDKLGPPALPVLPDWSPVAKVPGHWKPTAPLTAQLHQCVGACAVHVHNHERARLSSVPVSDYRGSGGRSVAPASPSERLSEPDLRLAFLSSGSARDHLYLILGSSMQKHFSFAEYYDSERMHWGNLRAWNDDTSIRTMLAQHGTVILPSGYSDPALVDISQAGGGTPYGAWTIAAADGSGQPGARELGIARHLGEYVAKITAKLKD